MIWRWYTWLISRFVRENNNRPSDTLTVEAKFQSSNDLKNALEST